MIDYLPAPAEPHRPSTIILPTYNVIGRCLTLAQDLQHHDYDLDFYVEEVIRSLEYAQNYPASYDRDIHMTIEGMGHLERLTENDRVTLNRMRRLLYDTLFQALVVVGAYDASGCLEYKFSAVHRGDVVVSMHPNYMSLLDDYDKQYL